MNWRIVALMVTGTVSGISPGAEPRPNVIFILADDLGWADTTPYGSKFHETPNLARLAARSVRFTNYYAASPLCSPTRSSILTGLYPARTGITAPVCHLPAVQLEKRLAPGNPNQRVLNADSLTRLKTEYPTIADIMKRAGYATAHFGKWHLGHGAGYEPKDRGFDLDIPQTPAAAGPGGGYLAPWRFVRDPKIMPKAGEHIDEWMAGQAARFIQEHKNRPFYLNFWLYSVHGPWNAKKDLIEKYRQTADRNAPQRNPLYAAMIKSMDEAVGKLLDALDAAQVSDHTIVVFTSDNGGYAYPPASTNPPGYEAIPATSNLPLRSGKASNYEGGTRVPCLVAWPGRANPIVTDSLFSSVDWFPTLLAMTGVQAPAPVKTDGVNQLPAILGQKPVRDTLFVHFPHGSEAQERFIPGFWPGTWVRRGEWKLIRFFSKAPDGKDLLELYDLKNDVGETRNLAGQHPDRVRDLSRLMDEFLRDTAAVIPKPNPNYGSKPGSPTAAGWSASKDAGLEVKDGVLVVKSTGKDPYLSTRTVPPGTGPYQLEIRMKSNSRGDGQVFFATADQPAFHRDRSVAFSPTHDGTWRTYSVTLPVEKALTALRLDPSTSPGEIQIEFLRLSNHEGKLVKSWTFPQPEKK